MHFQPHEVSEQEFHRLLVTAVAPRPIAWVSTISNSGVHNLAPFSYFNLISTNPPILGFCPQARRGEDFKLLGSLKDSLRNVRESGEFVINVVTFALSELMNLTSGEFDSSVDEFQVANLTMRPSSVVRPPQVAESPISYECKVNQILDFGTAELGGSLVTGDVVSIHLSEQVLSEGRIDPNRLDLVGRMGGRQYCRTTERFDMTRPTGEPSLGEL